jgi:hypothetical protein
MYTPRLYDQQQRNDRAIGTRRRNLQLSGSNPDIGLLVELKCVSSHSHVASAAKRAVS